MTSARKNCGVSSSKRIHILARRSFGSELDSSWSSWYTLGPNLEVTLSEREQVMHLAGQCLFRAMVVLWSWGHLSPMSMAIHLDSFVCMMNSLPPAFEFRRTILWAEFPPKRHSFTYLYILLSSTFLDSPYLGHLFVAPRLVQPELDSYSSLPSHSKARNVQLMPSDSLRPCLGPD